MRKIVASLVLSAGLILAVGPALASGDAVKLPTRDWGWYGVFGNYDQKQLKRGFQVFKDVCANCHSMKLVAYRNLAALGFSEDEIKAIAAEKEVTDGPNDEGAMFQRPARPSDRIVAPFPNDKAARAAFNGALPPDLSLINKARVSGPDYVFALLNGYGEPPAGASVADGMNWNKYFPGNQIGMPPQLVDDLVTYADGTKASVEQIGVDVVTFLNWAAEPELGERKSMGLKVMIFLLLLTGLLYALKKQIWSDVH
jgi:cytochrome c1